METDHSQLVAAIAGARRGEERAFATLYAAYNPLLMRYLRQQVPWVADDLAADTWLSAAKGLDSFGGDPTELRKWLFAIARRRVVDHYRREGRRVRTTSLADADHAPAPADTEDAALASLAADEAVAALVSELSESQAEVVLLRVVADLSVADVAEITGRSVGSVRVLQHRALRRLAELWERPGTQS